PRPTHLYLLPFPTRRSADLWTKHGPAFAKSGGGKHRNLESKSGAILVRVAGNRLIATRLNGKYWMYFNVPAILIATSDNLIDWTDRKSTRLNSSHGSISYAV